MKPKSKFLSLKPGFLKDRVDEVYFEMYRSVPKGTTCVFLFALCMCIIHFDTPGCMVYVCRLSICMVVLWCGRYTWVCVVYLREARYRHVPFKKISLKIITHRANPKYTYLGKSIKVVVNTCCWLHHFWQNWTIRLKLLSSYVNKKKPAIHIWNFSKLSQKHSNTKWVKVQ